MSPVAVFNDGNVVQKPEPPAANGHHHAQQSMLPRSLHHPPAIVDTAEGAYFHIEDGHSVLDASAGAAVACIGHGSRRVQDAVNAQMSKLSYAHTLTFSNRPGEELAQYLLETTGGAMSQAYFVGSGSEAMEAALKLARQYYQELDPPQPARSHFISRHGSYHGITLGALAVSGHVARRALYEPILMPNTSRVSACNTYRGLRKGESHEAYVARLAQELDDEFVRVGPGRVCAFVLEPVVGAALGCVPAVNGYLQAVEAVCKRHGALLIFDEIMCGMGRTGKMHAWQHENVVPDLQTIGKGLGGGYIPLAGVLIHDHIVKTLDHGTGAFVHGHTFQGHPVACAAALEVQKILREEDIIAHVQSKGALLHEELTGRLGHHPHVGNIRGKGLFWGIEFVRDRTDKKPFPPEHAVAMGVQDLGLGSDYGISLYPGTGSADGQSGDHVLLAPPLNVSREQIVLIAELTQKVVEGFFGAMDSHLGGRRTAF